MKIALFFHAWINDFEHCVGIVQEQLEAMEQSGLIAASSEFHIGVSADTVGACAVSMIAPVGSNVVIHPAGTCGELPTLCMLQQWLPSHQDWFVCYTHTKGGQYPKSTTWAAWRRCMSSVVVWNWKMCVGDLTQGFDTVGAHLIDPKKYGASVGNFAYWGGNFWWATAKHLLTLPVLSPNGPSRFEAEVFIGKTKRKINFRDHAPHWPGRACFNHR